MTDADPTLRRVVVEVSPDQLPGLVEVLGSYAATNKVSLHIGNADIERTWPSIGVEPEATLSPSGKQSKEEKLAYHIRKTYPKTADDYLGKEHFWILGEEVELGRRYTGTLFNEVCFPVLGNPRLGRGYTEVEKVEPDSIGLTVKSRIEVGMRFPPVQIASNASQLAVEAHLAGNPLGSAFIQRAITSRVVQMRSVISLGQNLAQTNASFSLKSQETLSKLMPRLLEFPR